MNVKTFLHVGCGPVHQAQAGPGFHGEGWRELRLDIDPAVEPDIVGSMTDMAGVADGSVDAVFSSHNLEHLYAHEVPRALAEFLRVLTDGGYAVITCPDLQSVGALLVEGRLTEPAYESPAGPIAALDILYGHRPALAAGNDHMAHRCGFTLEVLLATLKGAGFAAVAGMGRPAAFDLWALCSKAPLGDDALRRLAADHFPGGSPPIP